MSQNVERPPIWRWLFPEGRCISYEGDDPEGFRQQITAEFGFDPAADPAWGEWIEWEDEPGGFCSYGFHCPPEHLDAIYGGGRFPMGS